MSLGLEREVKFRVESWTEGERRLAEGAARLKEPRHFERNSLFDFPDRALQRRGEALRLRRAGGRAWLTYKGPLDGGGRIKQRREYETSLGDADAAEEILRRLGLEERFRYEKFRAVYSLEKVEATLDQTPIGVFIEIEGPPSEIERAARALGLEMDVAISVSYPRLYQTYRDQTPDSPEFMTFPAESGTE